MMGSDQRVWPSEQTNWAKDNNNNNNNNNNLLFTRHKIALKYDLMLACLLIDLVEITTKNMLTAKQV